MGSLGWFILACIVVALIIYAIVASQISAARRRRKRRKRLPDAESPLLVGRRYNIQLSHGRVLGCITVVGMSEDVGDESWQDREWIVGKREDGRRVYLRPNTIRFVEDA